MRLEIENIGIIAGAKLEFAGINVFAGANDSGKSTLGKIVFAILKTQFLTPSAQPRLKRLIRNELNGTIKGSFFSFTQPTKESSAELEARLEVFLALVAEDKIEDARKDLKEIRNEIFHDNSKKYPSHMKSRFMLSADQVEHYLMMLKNKDTLSTVILSNLLSNALGAQLFRNGSKNSKLIFSDNIAGNYSGLIEKKGNAVSFKAEFSLNDSEQLDTTYIENASQFDSEIEVNLGNLPLRGSQSDASYHKWDFQNKLKNIIDDKTTESSIEHLVDGSLVFEKTNESFAFVRSGQKIPMNATATGIKCLASFSLLEKNGFLSPGHTLILDEPEVHLHPAWQVEFANYLVGLYKSKGVRIFISSHSPYFIQALDTLRKTEDIADSDVKFFMSRKVSHHSVVREIEDADEIYASLADAYTIIDHYELSKRK